MTALVRGDHVLITSAGHRKDGKVGTVVDGPGKFMGTYTVMVDSMDYGFLRSELTKLIPGGRDTDPRREDIP